jgi:hypothetical protein
MLNIRIVAGAVGADSGSTKFMRLLAAPALQHVIIPEKIFEILSRHCLVSTYSILRSQCCFYGHHKSE